MAIKAACPSCGSEFNFGDQLAGKKVKCKKCEATITVPAGDPDDDQEKIKAGDDDFALPSKKKSRASSRDEDDDDDDDRGGRRGSKKPDAAKKGSNTLVIILGVVGGVLLLCCGGSAVGIYIAVNKASEAAKDFAKKFDEDMRKQQQLQQKGKVVAEEKIEGKLLLTKDDKIDPTGPQMLVGRMGGAVDMKRAKAFPVQFSKGKTYIINMKQSPGSMLDPYLVLADPKGKTIVTDDDSGGFRHARITHTAEINGQYQIIATSFGDSTGAFLLTVEER